MSLLNLLHFKRTASKTDSVYPFCGYTITERTTEAKYESFIHCLIKGLFIFAAAFGALSGVLSEFEISYNYGLVMIIVLISSLLLSLLHLNKVVFNIGYPLIFVVFTTMILRCRLYANSGFQALLNIINEEYSAHFLMNFTRESTETITDRYMTITMAAIFIGVFLAILINVGIFNDMYFLTTFNLTFWPLQIGIYIGKYPSFLSLFLLFFSYFGIYFLKHSKHYHYIAPGKKKTFFRTYKYQEQTYIHYKSNARSMVQICTFALVLSLFFSSFASAAAVSSQSQSSVISPIKEVTDPYVKIFVQNGIMGFFNRYEATGGLSNGRLGGISSVRPDYQTDLIITFAPYAYESLYLRAFIGAEYTGSKWNKPGETMFPYRYPAITDYETYHNFCAYSESSLLSSMMEQGAVPSMKGTMMIENIDAAPNYLYLPYYTLPLADAVVSKENIIMGSTLISSSEDASSSNATILNYIPYSQSQADLAARTVSEYHTYRNSHYSDAFSTYEEECFNNYLQIPDDIAPRLIEYQKEIGTSPNLSTQISLIRQFLTTNYSYDMAPGSTPYNKDFVLYFLDEQQKGYCSHFATAATLIFRSYGIPARYVEGYVASQLAVSERARATEYAYEDFFEGENILGTNRVVEVEINDGDAHAWVEIFVDGFGWIPIEVTPPSDDTEEPTYGDFLSALTGLLAGDSEGTPVGGENNQPEYNYLFRTLQFQSSPIVSVFILILAFALCSPLIVAGIRKLKAYILLKRDYSKGIYDSTIAYAYVRLHKRLKKNYPQDSLILPEDTLRVLKALLKDYEPARWNNYTLEELIALTEKSCFCEKQLPKETANLLIAFYRYSYKRIKSKKR